MGILGQGIFHHGSEGFQLWGGGDDLLADWVVGVIGVDQRDEVGGHVHPEQAGGGEGFALAFGQREDVLEIFDGVKPVAELPAPAVPFVIRNIGEVRCSFGWELKFCHYKLQILGVIKESDYSKCSHKAEAWRIVIGAEETTEKSWTPFHDPILPYEDYGRNSTSTVEICLMLILLPSRSLTDTRTQVGPET